MLKDINISITKFRTGLATLMFLERNLFINPDLPSLEKLQWSLDKLSVFYKTLSAVYSFVPKVRFEFVKDCATFIQTRLEEIWTFLVDWIDFDKSHDFPTSADFEKMENMKKEIEESVKGVIEFIDHTLTLGLRDIDPDEELTEESRVFMSTLKDKVLDIEKTKNISLL